jgi:tetratricopeptide (TPR) repeat protein
MAASALGILENKMRNSDRNYLNLASGYITDGLYKEALDVLLRFRGKNPLISYYTGFLYDKIEKREEAGSSFLEASLMPVDYIFPYSLETVTIMEKALEYKPDDEKAYYYLGNILYDRQPGKAISYWEKSVSLEPGFAVAWRNLGWGYNYHQRDPLKAVSAYEKAFAIDKKEALWYSELDALYETVNAPVEKRLALFEGSNEIVQKRDDAFVRQITVLTLAGRPEKSVEYLNGRNFSYREGNSRVREVIIDAHLILGRKLYAKKEYSGALDHFLKAQVPDEEAGSARAGNRDVQVNYFIGLAWEALRNNAKARSYFKLGASQTIRRSGYMTYYQGLCYKKLGDNRMASELFESMITEGDRLINEAGTEGDFFAIFGEREAENARRSQAFTIRGLGYKGTGETEKAKKDLNEAVALQHGNLWANAEL